MIRGIRERDPAVIGAVGLVLIGIVLALALNIGRLPFVSGGDDYVAYLAEAGGLRGGDPVIISGLTVGAIDSLKIENGAVRVDFHTRTETVLPGATRASVSVQTLLGAKGLVLDPLGAGRMRPGDTIPVSRTTAPYDVTSALSDLTTNTQQIDTAKLTQALNTISDTFQDSPPALHSALVGLTRVSNTVASRDEALRQLLTRSNSFTGVLADRNNEVSTLLADGNSLLGELQDRRDTIEHLLVNTASVTSQLDQLIRENRDQATPALTRLKSVLELLDRNRAGLAGSLRESVPFVRALGEAVASGPFFQVYIQNLIPYDLRPDLASALKAARLPGGQR